MLKLAIKLKCIYDFFYLRGSKYAISKKFYCYINFDCLVTFTYFSTKNILIFKQMETIFIL